MTASAWAWVTSAHESRVAGAVVVVTGAFVTDVVVGGWVVDVGAADFELLPHALERHDDQRDNRKAQVSTHRASVFRFRTGTRQFGRHVRGHRSPTARRNRLCENASDRRHLVAVRPRTEGEP